MRFWTRVFTKPRSKEYKERFFAVKALKWRYKYDNGQVISVERIPYCTKHDFSLVPDDSSWVCPIIDCPVKQSEEHLSKARVRAESYIEHMVRNRKVR